MKNICLFVTLMMFCLTSLGSCEKDSDSPNRGVGNIYGSVIDIADGSPVANANVSLRPGEETTLTGSDGRFEFLNIPEGEYYIIVSKSEYIDLIDEYIIKVNRGRTAKREVQIQKCSDNLRLTDTYGNDIISLNFGNDPFVVNMPFNIFNNKSLPITCSLVYSCPWIKWVSTIPEMIYSGQTVTVNVEIDRSRLASGKNETILNVISENAKNALLIIAIGENRVPAVRTLPVTDDTGLYLSPTFVGEVVDVGNPEYHSRGFCYSFSNSFPTIDDERIDVSGNGLGKFYNKLMLLDDGAKFQNTRCYVRAWLMYDNDNKIEYGDVQSFIFGNI